MSFTSAPDARLARVRTVEDARQLGLERCVYVRRVMKRAKPVVDTKVMSQAAAGLPLAALQFARGAGVSNWAELSNFRALLRLLV
jgi:hypothetical protein